MQGLHRYLTDDRDIKPINELVILQGGNSDWYVGVGEEGTWPMNNFVRLCTSGGASSACPGLTAAIAVAYRAMQLSDNKESMQEPVFIPKPGQVDFTNARWAPVINCVVKHGEKILIVKRSADMRLYPNYWNGISGFLDDQRSLEEKVKDELFEELGTDEDEIVSIITGTIFHQDEPLYNKTWIVHPVLVEVDTDRVVLDWEAQDYKWVTLGEAKNYKLLPGFDIVLEKLFPDPELF